MKAVIYTRVSTDEQAEKGTSLADQERECRRKAESLRTAVTGQFQDAGISGAYYATRPGIQAALAALEQGQADTLIVYNVSRLSRDREHQSAIKKRVERAGGRIVFCDMNFEETPEGDLAYGIIGTFAEYERQAIRDRTMRGRRRRAQEGVQPYRSWAPLGYEIVTKGSILAGVHAPGTEGAYLIVEEQAAIVRGIFARYGAGDSLRGVARALTAQGVTPPRRAACWRPPTIRRILSNPVYKGQAAAGRTRRYNDERRQEVGLKTHYQRPTREQDWILMDAPAIVEEATWERCQERLTGNRAGLSGRPELRHLLAGLVLCPRCGLTMRGKRTGPGARYAYYSCRLVKGENTPRRLDSQVCPQRQIRAHEMEAAVRAGIEAVLRRPEMIAEALRAWQDRETDPDAEKRRRDTEAELSALAARERIVVDAQIAGVAAGADPALYLARLGEIAARRRQAQEALAGLEAQERPARGAVQEIAACLQTGGLWEMARVALEAEQVPVAEKHRLLSQIIRRVVPTLDGEGTWNGCRLELLPLVAGGEGIGVGVHRVSRNGSPTANLSVIVSCSGDRFTARAEVSLTRRAFSSAAVAVGPADRGAA